jgi:ataxin-3
VGAGASRFLNADQSRNMDDSGFFSSQVMDEALKTYNLQLVRWRHPSLRSIQESPDSQEAFVFNLSQHWFVIRRFGHSKHFWFDREGHCHLGVLSHDCGLTQTEGV